MQTQLPDNLHPTKTMSMKELDRQCGMAWFRGFQFGIVLTILGIISGLVAFYLLTIIIAAA